MGSRPPSSPLRGYQIAHLTCDGDIVTTTRLAPATHPFERCFAAIGRGALLTTDSGPRAIEDLWPGDQVLTTSHGMQPILWRGQVQVNPGARALGSSLTGLLRFTHHALGLRRPSVDLLLGSAAQLAYRSARVERLTGHDTAFIPARDLVDGDTVIEVHPASPVEVYQLGLPHHACLSVGGGLEIASLHPGPAHEWARTPSERASMMSLFPHLAQPEDFGPVLHPRFDLRDLEVDPIPAQAAR